MKHWLGITALAVLFVFGCSYTSRSRLPEHIHTVSVGVFGNSTSYIAIEGKLTSAIIS